MASSDVPELKRASRRLRRFCDDLDRRGVQFVEVECREGVDLCPRYVAYTRIGRIFFEFDGLQWILSLALPGARFFATYEDWLSCLYGRPFGGYRESEHGSVAWLENILKQEKSPEIDVAVLDQVVEDRMSKPPVARWKLVFMVVGVLVVLGALLWYSYVSGYGIAASRAASGIIGVLVVLALVWGSRLRRRQFGHRKRGR